MPSFDRPHKPETGISPWVARFAALIRPGGRVLDLAAGNGRHTRWLLARGFRVVAADVDVSGLAGLKTDEGCEVLEADLEASPWPFEAESFDAIVVTNYLHRPHFPHLEKGLREGGVLLFDTFAAGNERLGRPRNPDFLLAPGELLTGFGSRLQIVAYEAGQEDRPRPTVRQRVCAVRAEGPVRLPG